MKNLKLKKGCPVPRKTGIVELLKTRSYDTLQIKSKGKPEIP